MSGIFLSYKRTFSRKNVYLFFIYFAFFLFNGPLEQSISLFFESKGFSTFSYGLFLSLNNMMGIILPMLAALFTLKTNYKLVTTLGLGVAIFGGVCLVYSQYLSTMILFALFLFAGRYFFNFSFGSVVTAEIPSRERATYFVIRDIFLYGGMSFGLFAAGYVIDGLSIKAMYLLFSLGLGIVAVFIAKGGTVEKSAEAKESKKNSFQLSGLKNKTVFTFVVIQCFKLVYGSAVSFVPLLGVKIGIEYDSILKVLGSVVFANGLLSFFLAYLVSETGKKKYYILDILIDIIPCLLFALTRSVPIYILGIVISTIKDSFAPISFSYLYDCLDEETTIGMVGMIESISNIVGIVSPVMIGLLWEFSYQAVFLLGAAACILAAVIGIKNLPDF